MKDIFCANEQKLTPHVGSVDGNGEFVFTCTNEIATGEVDDKGNDITTPCGRFLKFPADITPEKFNELIVIHEEHNTGQIDAAEQQKKLDAMISALVGTPTE